MKTKNYWGNWVLISCCFIFMILNLFLGDRSFVFPINLTTYTLPYSYFFWILIMLTSLFGSIYWAFESYKHPTNQRIKNINYVLLILSLLGIVIPIWWHINYSFDTIDSQFSTYASMVFHIYANALLVQVCAVALLILSFILMLLNLTMTAAIARKNQKTQDTILDEDK